MPEMTPAERRRALIDDLRNLPPEWRWDFDRVGNGRDCGCAWGRAEVLFNTRYCSLETTFKLLGLPDYHRPIFGLTTLRDETMGYEQLYGVSSRAEVTPEMVADALERVGP